MSSDANQTPLLLRQRAWWLVPLAGWAIAVGFSLLSHIEEMRRHTFEVATAGARNMFGMVVLARAWNAEHGGVYVPVSPKAQPNPYLEHPRRDVTTTDGQRLTLINPAYMTRLIAELAERTGGTVFHITSLNPIRPKNTPDDWERRALADFEQGAKESVEVVTDEKGQPLLRYMAPLLVAKPCLVCHEKQGYKLGDIRGGISVSVPYGPIAAAADDPRRQDVLTHLLVFVVVAVCGWWLLEQLRRRWLDLVRHIEALDRARSALEHSNVALARARDAAKSAARAKSMFLANMSHELRTPLNSVIGMTHLLLQDAKGPREQEFLTQISASGQHLNSLIGDLLDLARLDAGNLTLDSKPFALADVVEAALKEHASAAAEKNLSIGIEIDPALSGSLRGDPTRLGQALSHLVGNAVKFTRAGWIRIVARRTTTESAAPRVRIDVQDTGIGIPAETIARLFHPFEQADGTTTRAQGGSGLGLALCRQLAHLLGGRVGVESIPGRGSTFWLELPLVDASETVASPARPDARAASGAAAETLGPAEWAKVRGVADRLESFLEADDFRASTLLRDEATSIRAALGPAADRITAAVAGYHFEEALAALREARRNIPQLQKKTD